MGGVGSLSLPGVNKWGIKPEKIADISFVCS
jgi:hypothetical protein